jgi:hypothetical protein
MTAFEFTESSPPLSPEELLVLPCNLYERGLHYCITVSSRPSIFIAFATVVATKRFDTRIISDIIT